MREDQGRAALLANRIRREAGAADRDPVRHARHRRRSELALGVVFPFLLLALWQAASVNGWISRFNYPAPTDVLREFLDTKGLWWTSIKLTLVRLLWGYFWGVLAGVAVGVAMGMGHWTRATLEPTLNALYTVPKLALISIFLIVLGFDNKPVIAVVAVTVFFFVWIQTQSTVMSISPSYREAAQSFGSTRRQMFRHVILPASLPQIFVGLRVAGGVAILTVIGAEFVFAPKSDGIGYRINNARTVLDPKQAYVGLVVAGVLGVLFTLVIRLLDRLASPWAREGSSAG
ncbi:MAG: binding-protein-dependent transport system inner rane component [Acidimicrobiales bacterium]|nr:binding-protein-dependent transport system inner rane component [Acidimicrobiales bacterium]